MTEPGPRYSSEEFKRRGEEIFERHIRAHVADRPAQDFVVIDIETGDFEVDANERTAADRLSARRPDAQPWMRLVGSPYSRRFGLGFWRPRP